MQGVTTVLDRLSCGTCCCTMPGTPCLACCWDICEAMRICCWMCCWCWCCFCWAYAACCMCCSRSWARLIWPWCLPEGPWPGEMGGPPTDRLGGWAGGGGGFSITKLPAVNRSRKESKQTSLSNIHYFIKHYAWVLQMVQMGKLLLCDFRRSGSVVPLIP